MDFWASAKSPERFEPAMIPVTDGKKIPIRIVNEVVISATTWLNVWETSLLLMSSLALPLAMNCPASKKLSYKLSRRGGGTKISLYLRYVKIKLPRRTPEAIPLIPCTTVTSLFKKYGSQVPLQKILYNTPPSVLLQFSIPTSFNRRFPRTHRLKLKGDLTRLNLESPKGEVQGRYPN